MRSPSLVDASLDVMNAKRPATTHEDDLDALISTHNNLYLLWRIVLMTTSKMLASLWHAVHTFIDLESWYLHVWYTRALKLILISEAVECSLAKIGTVKVPDRDSKGYRDWPDPNCHRFLKKKLRHMACKRLNCGRSANHAIIATHRSWSTLTRAQMALPSTRHAHARRLNEVQIRTNGLTSIAVTTHKLSLLTFLVFEEHALLPVVMFW